MDGKVPQLRMEKWPRRASTNSIFPELGRSCHMETAHPYFLHCRLVDSWAELKLKCLWQ